MSSVAPSQTFDDASPTRAVYVGGLEAGRHAWLTDQTRRALEVLGAAGDVRVQLVDDAAMSQAHEKYSGVAGTTDVLTFDLTIGPKVGPAVLDTDILVCVDEARRQGAARGHTAERELLLYIIHGVLHCLGHDDHDEAAAARMHAEEDRVLEAIGVGRTYASGGAP